MWNYVEFSPELRTYVYDVYVECDDTPEYEEIIVEWDDTGLESVE